MLRRADYFVSRFFYLFFWKRFFFFKKYFMELGKRAERLIFQNKNRTVSHTLQNIFRS